MIKEELQEKIEKALRDFKEIDLSFLSMTDLKLMEKRIDDLYKEICFAMIMTKFQIRHGEEQ